jgi:hypothetical protein
MQNKAKKIKFEIFKNYYKHKILYTSAIFIILLILIITSFFIEKNKSKDNEIKICLCVIGKKENLYIKEYANHYKQLGYNHIFLYDNNDINNNERFSTILKNEINNGFVTIIDYIGFRGKSGNAQREAYYDCYKNNNRKYDWLSFFDLDEYLILKQKNETIHQLLSNERYKNCFNIKINWLVFDAEKEAIYYENKPLNIRFKKPLYNSFSNRHIKSTVRGKLKNYWEKWDNPHSSLSRYRACSSSGKFVDNKTPFIVPPDYKYALIKHFYKKSFEEFCNKLKRGWTDDTDQKALIIQLINDNKNNKQKFNIIKKTFNLTNSY